MDSALSSSSSPQSFSPPAEASSAQASASPTTIDEAGYTNLCGICYSEVDPFFNPRGLLNSCNHLFCGYCIKEWGKNTNICPLCKLRFTRIVMTYQSEAQFKQLNPIQQKKFSARSFPYEETTKVRRKNFSDWYVSSDEDEEGNEDGQGLRNSLICSVCKQSDNAIGMIFCDRRDCPYIVHLECLNLKERPLSFLCASCKEEQSALQDDKNELSLLIDNTHSTASSSVSSKPAQAPPAPPPPMKLSMAAPQAVRSALESLRKRKESLPSSLNTVKAKPAKDDNLYFLHADPHTRSAQLQLKRWKEDHKDGSASDVFPRSTFGMESFPPVSGLGGTPRHIPRSFERHLQTLQHGEKRVREADEGKRKRGHGLIPAALEQLRKVEAEEERALSDPIRRREIVERKTREEAKEIIDLVREQRHMARQQLRFNSEGEVAVLPSPLTAVQEEQAIWQEAMDRCRPAVTEKIRTRLFQLRNRKERALRVQAQREAVALGKLARLIAAHRIEGSAPNASLAER